MTRHFDLSPRCRNRAFAVDEEGGTLDPHVLLPVHGFLFPYVIGLAGRLLKIGRQSIGKLFFFNEFIELLHFVLGHANDDGIGRGKIAKSIPEATGFLGAA